MSFKRRNKPVAAKGFTILETVIAIGIVLVSFTTAATLITAAVELNVRLKNQTLAANLAQTYTTNQINIFDQCCANNIQPSWTIASNGIFTIRYKSEYAVAPISGTVTTPTPATVSDYALITTEVTWRDRLGNTNLVKQRQLIQVKQKWSSIRGIHY